MTSYRTGAAILLVIAPALAGCGASLSDYSLKDQEWFSRPARMFNRSVSIETPPLSSTAQVSPADLIGADGSCAGVSPGDANAQAQGQPAPTGAVALGHTECDVARAAGTPDNVNISANERGERVAVLTYTRGPRPGIYRFTSGRLTDEEAAPAPPAPAKPAKRSKKHA
ncbi:hypothetical protein [Bradyrhizobium sp. WD16]|uniref:hypothetical protein n=1 Tax=Bradyrhizobium sp. WD16 TaxID=1521768 RepID=UPI0020A41C6A|nr:hypothetical protein [Bradyrhizobium sp. WD16]UTD29425.1 hypothetical protein DB459_23445 [Bradyrhizobium sp. WD16]